MLNYHKPKTTKHLNFGYSLIELMLALAIIAIMLVVATRYYSTTSSSQKVNAGVNMLQAVINAGEDIKNTTNSYKSIVGIQKLIDQGLVPKNFSDTNINPWGGSINATSGTDTNFVLTLTNIPLEDCLSLAEIMQQKGASFDKSSSCKSNTYTANYPEATASQTPNSQRF